MFPSKSDSPSFATTLLEHDSSMILVKLQNSENYTSAWKIFDASTGALVAGSLGWVTSDFLNITVPSNSSYVALLSNAASTEVVGVIFTVSVLYQSSGELVTVINPTNLPGPGIFQQFSVGDPNPVQLVPPIGYARLTLLLLLDKSNDEYSWELSDTVTGLSIDSGMVEGNSGSYWSYADIPSNADYMMTFHDSGNDGFASKGGQIDVIITDELGQEKTLFQGSGTSIGSGVTITVPVGSGGSSVISYLSSAQITSSQLPSTSQSQQNPTEPSLLPSRLPGQLPSSRPTQATTGSPSTVRVFPSGSAGRVFVHQRRRV